MPIISNPVNSVLIYNGTTWVTGNNSIVSRSDVGAFGLSSTNGTVFGGNVLNTETYNGTTWTIEANMNTARGNLSAFGSSSTDGTAEGGSDGAGDGAGGTYNVTETYSASPNYDPEKASPYYWKETTV